MTDTARERIVRALLDAEPAIYGVLPITNVVINALGIPETDLDGLIAGTHRVVPVKLTEEMEETARRIEDGPLVSYQEHWDQMIAAAQPKEKADD